MSNVDPSAKPAIDTVELDKNKVEPSLLSKEAWHQAVEAEVQKSHEAGQPLAVLFIDVNHFKDINDRLGHETGNLVIEEIGETIRRSFRSDTGPNGEDRPIDQVSVSETQDTTVMPDEAPEAGHIGGDEFAVLCKTDETSARAIVIRLRKTFDQYLNRSENFKLNELGIGLAIGVGVLMPGMTSSDLLREADKAMYVDKQAQLPELNEHQQRALCDAAAVLRLAGLQPGRLRDLSGYELKYPHLFEED